MVFFAQLQSEASSRTPSLSGSDRHDNKKSLEWGNWEGDNE